MISTNRAVSLTAWLLVTAACSSTPPAHPPVVDESTTGTRITKADLQAAQEFRALQRKDAQEAYQQGVQDTLMDFRGKMNAKAGFVWQQPIVEYVEMPARVVNGALIPAHKEPVIIKPGMWIEHNGEPLPLHDSQ